MERIQTLINRLQEQVRQHADIAQMQVTLQLMQAELSQLQKSSVRTLGTSKVAVVLPMPVAVASVQEAEPLPGKEPPAMPAPNARPRAKTQLDLHFDPMNEIPTFSQY